MQKSFGMAICYNDARAPCILMCRRRITYEFFEFTIGRYELSQVPELLNGMTTSEKVDIFSQDFGRIWTRMNPLSKFYTKKCKDKFLHTIANIDIREAIRNSRNGYLTIELPKGRRKSSELPLDTAIRETYEEVHIQPEQYKVIFDIEPIIYNSSDYNVEYMSQYYVAKAHKKYDFKFCDLQINEIEDVQWWTLHSLRMYSNENDIRNMNYIRDVAIPALERFIDYVLEN